MWCADWIGAPRLKRLGSLRPLANGCVVAVVLLVGLAPARARAEGEQFVDLSYEVAPDVTGCLSASAFRSVVAKRLGYDPHQPGATPRVHVQVRAAEAVIEGSIEWVSDSEGPIGERHFSSPADDCRDMTATMAFVVAVHTQLMATEPGGEAPTDAPVEPEPAPVPSPPVVAEDPPDDSELPVPKPAAEDERGWLLEAGAGPAVGVGLAPHAVGLGRLFAAVRSRSLVGELGAEFTAPSRTNVDGDRGFRHGFMLAAAAGCGSRGPLDGCALAKLGQIRVEGAGVDHPASPRGVVAQVGMRIAYSLPLDHHLVVRGHLDGLYLLTPWTIDLNREAVWAIPQFGAVAGIDLAVAFHDNPRPR